MFERGWGGGRVKKRCPWCHLRVCLSVEPVGIEMGIRVGRVEMHNQHIDSTHILCESPKSWNGKPSYHGGSSTLRAPLHFPSPFPLLLLSNLIFVGWLSLTHIWDQSVTLLIVLCSLMRGPACLFGVAAHLVDHYYNKLVQQFDYD